MVANPQRCCTPDACLHAQHYGHLVEERRVRLGRRERREERRERERERERDERESSCAVLEALTYELRLRLMDISNHAACVF